MIRSVTVTNNIGEKAKIVLCEEEPSHGFLITSIDGLGPAKASINTSELSLFDGSTFNSSRLEARNIVFKLLLAPAPTIEKARLNTYKYFPIKNKIMLEFETDSRKAKIEGWVESNEPDIFSDAESANISVICPNPYFYKILNDGEGQTSFINVEPNFEFEYENETLLPTTEYGFITSEAIKNIRYSGDVETGLTITITARDETGDISISNLNMNEHMIIDDDKVEIATGSPISVGDIIVINTEQGHKSATLFRGAFAYNILNCLGRNTSWLSLQKGDNHFKYDVDAGLSFADVVIENSTIYEGI